MIVFLQLISMFLANAGLVCWMRSESRSDWKHMDTKMDAIHAEMKDFHRRLLEIDRDFHKKLLDLEARRHRDRG